MEKELREKLPGGRFHNVSPARSRAMSAVRGKGNVTTERRLRLALVRARIAGWKLHPKEIPGCPDFYFPKNRLAIFTDGCFWHGCRDCGHIPSKHSAFWSAKIEGNRRRDAEKTAELRAKKIRVLRLWEHELKEDLKGCVDTVRGMLSDAVKKDIEIS